MSTEPAVYTKPLVENFTSLYDRYAQLVTAVWITAFGYVLDEWQVNLLRALLETYPPDHPRAGQLRYRSALVSVARQNGKTEIMAVLGLIGLLRRDNGLVVGIASTRDQARIVYDRVARAISATTLKKLFDSVAKTRNIEGKNGTVYMVKPAKETQLQGLPVDLGAVDEVHLLDPELWNALVSGLGGRANGIVVGITTAGDDNSVLLKTLYKRGQAAANGDVSEERFGFFCWEAPEARVPETDEEFLQFLRAANPALSSGRTDEEGLLADLRGKHPADLQRYHFNRFTESLTAFLPLSMWGACARSAGDTFPRDRRPVFAYDVDPGWKWATVTATAKDDQGTFHTKVIWSNASPTPEMLIDVAQRLAHHNPRTNVMDGYGLKAVGAALKAKGLPVMLLNRGDILTGSARFYALVGQQKVKHGVDPLLTYQVPGTIRKNDGDKFRISRKDSSVEIDAVLATMEGVYAAETLPEASKRQVWSY